MEYLKHKVCDADLNVEPGDASAVCGNCGAPQVLPTLDAEKSASIQPENAPIPAPPDAEMQAQATNADTSPEADPSIPHTTGAKRLQLSKKALCLLGIVVVLAAAFAVLLLTRKSPLQKLTEYVQSCGTPFDGGYRLLSDSTLENGQTSLIAYGDGSFVFAYDLESSILENSYRLKASPEGDFADFEVHEKITLQVGFRSFSNSVDATGKIEKTKYPNEAGVTFETYRPFTIQLFTVEDVDDYYTESSVTNDVKSFTITILDDVSNMLKLSGTGVTIEDFGFTSKE